MRAALRVLGRVPWWLAVFAVALLARLGFLWASGEPLLYLHQYTYFNGGLRIAGHPAPLGYVLYSDEWRYWNGRWTIAPLYYWMVALVFRVTGHLLPLLLLQGLLDSLTAVMVGVLGRRLAGPRGAIAGFAYALHLPALELAAHTMTENAHTVLLVAAFVLLARAGAALREEQGALATSLLAGVLLGLSALARAVGLLFAPLVLLWFVAGTGGWSGWRRGLKAGLAFALGTAAAVLPWTTRNLLLIGDPNPIESVSIYNLWVDNSFVPADRLAQQEARLAEQPTPAERRSLAFEFVRRGLARRPDLFLPKVRANFAHFTRPEGLHYLLLVEEPRPLWRYLAALVLDDGVLLLTIPLFAVFLAAGPAGPLRRLIGLWTAYYLLMVVVVFHNDVRYRSALMPMALAGAVAGAAVLASAEQRRRWAAWLGLALGLAVIGWRLQPYLEPARSAVRGWWRLRGVDAVLARGDLRGAFAQARSAAAADPRAARPYLRYARALLRAGRLDEAAVAYRLAGERRPDHWTPVVTAPALLQAMGRLDEMAPAVARANQLSHDVDPWLALDTAWREVSAPRTDEIRLADGDYGAVRDFFHPGAGFRWSRGHATLRLVPATPAAAYEVTLEMGTPLPSPLERTTVRARVRGGAEARFDLDREVRPYTWRTPAPAGGVLVVELEAPTWNLAFQNAEQGVRVHRLAIKPSS
jgi:4-amino-4-deoxy-L-arabinose transferase-like glycosyltransferase